MREQGELVVGVGILRMIVPTELLADHAQIIGDQWKEFVMHCRLQSEEFPPHIQPVTENAVIMGPILKANDDMVEDAEGEDLNFRQLEPWRLQSGESVQQQCLKGIGLIRALNQRSRLWFEILP